MEDRHRQPLDATQSNNGRQVGSFLESLNLNI
jgi:hypothetical protein